jgi:hypothetical protein
VQLSVVFTQENSRFLALPQQFLVNFNGMLDFVIGIEDRVRSASSWSNIFPLPLNITVVT